MSSRLNHARLSIARKVRSGDPCTCPKCTGRLTVANTVVKESAGVRVQYLKCDLCEKRPEHNKIIVPLEFFPARRARG